MVCGPVLGPSVAGGLGPDAGHHAGRWWLYYAFDALPNVGLRGILLPLGLMAAAWALIAFPAMLRRHRRAQIALSDARILLIQGT